MRIGLCLDRDHAVASRAGPPGTPGRMTWLSERALDPLDGDRWPALEAYLSELVEAHGATEVGIALRPSLVRTKVLALPPVSERDLRALLERNAPRWFASCPEQVACAARRLERPRGGPCLTLAMAADLSVVNAIHEAAAEAGVACVALTAASVALAHAVAAEIPDLAAGDAVVVVWTESWKEGLALRGGLPRAVERWDWAAVEEVPALCGRLARAGLGETSDARRVLVVGDPEGQDVVSLLSEDRQAEAAAACVGWSEKQDSDILAGLGAATLASSWPLLLPPSVREARERRQRRSVARILAAAALLLVLAAVIHLYGLRRELSAVVSQRRAHAAEVERALQLRLDVSGVQRRLEGLGQLETSLPRWSQTFSALAEALPDSSYLVTLASDSGGVRIEGAAPNSALAFRALRASPRLPDVRLLATFRPERGGHLERFDLHMGRRLASAAPPVPVAGGTP